MKPLDDVVEALRTARALLRVHRQRRAGLAPLQAHIDAAIRLAEEAE